MSYIYKLDLEDGKYYFGISSDTVKDIGEHINGKKGGWTSIYKVIRWDIINGDNTTLIYWILTYMKQYGYNSIRGGYWEQTYMFKNPPPVLMKFIKGKTKYNKSKELDENGDTIMS